MNHSTITFDAVRMEEAARFCAELDRQGIKFLAGMGANGEMIVEIIS